MVKRSLDPVGDRDLLIIGAGAAGLIVVGVGGLWTSMHLAAWFTGDRPPATSPVALVLDLIRGRIHWTGTATIAAGVLFVALVLVVVLLIVLTPHRTKMRPDGSARYMAKAPDLAHLTGAGAAAKAKRLGFPGAGLPLGAAVRGGRDLFASWEDTCVMIAGPRTMKTTAYAVPCLVTAPGAALATSNKRDLFDVTCGVRSQLGTVWTFDPQKVANTQPGWWWNPLSYIAPVDAAGRLDPSETRAEKLAGQFVTSNRADGARTDAYFDGEAENLIGLLLLAAACGGRPITDVYLWLTKPVDETPLEQLEHWGFPLQHESLYALAQLPDKQREGVYGTARSLMGFLRNRDIVCWVTRQPGLPAFDPAAFARSTDTLYSLSREGAGSVGPLVAALTMAVLDALEDHATRSPGGRLPIPFVAVLDEAANICRLRGLDDQYSHYGSRGIIPFTFLQSWHQGVQVWGEHGMEKLWSAANVKVYGGGVDDDRFLRRLSDLIGTAERITRSASTGRGARTITRSVQDQVILTPAELRELPQGRAVVFASGTPAVLTEPRQWFNSPHADQIRKAMAG